MAKNRQLPEIQAYLLESLKDLLPILKKHKIGYFACGGTMIGAVREKGFIPWDDDIDLFMARPDYDKLMDLARENDGKIGKYFKVSAGELGNSLFPFCKVYDTRFEIEDTEEDGENNLFIDIFPYDGLPDSEEERLNFYNQVVKKRHAIELSRLSFKGINQVTKNKLLLPAKYLLKLRTKLGGNEKRLQEYLKLCKKYSFKDSKYVWCNVWGDFYDLKIEKSDIETTKMPFEDIKINVMKGYDKYLSGRFGDYMTPPEEKDRETHGLKIKRVENGG